ncbi:MAG TPA: hypothetical protein VGJ30_10555 [Candidatus Angelobacter sp.]
MKAWLSLFLLVLIVSAQTSTPPVTELRVRVVDVRDAHPYSSRTILVQFHVPQTPELQTLEGTTGADGVAVFRFPEAVPKVISTHVAGEGLYACYRFYPIDTHQVLTDGIVARCTTPPQGCACKFSKRIDEIQTRPGEAVLPVRPFTKWERIAGHLWE